MPLPNDGEVICQSCQAALNREDLLCWRCGSRSLDRSRLETYKEGFVYEAFKLPRFFTPGKIQTSSWIDEMMQGSFKVPKS